MLQPGGGKGGGGGNNNNNNGGSTTTTTDDDEDDDTNSDPFHCSNYKKHSGINQCDYTNWDADCGGLPRVCDPTDCFNYDETAGHDPCNFDWTNCQKRASNFLYCNYNFPDCRSLNIPTEDKEQASYIVGLYKSGACNFDWQECPDYDFTVFDYCKHRKPDCRSIPNYFVRYDQVSNGCDIDWTNCPNGKDFYSYCNLTYNPNYPVDYETIIKDFDEASMKSLNVETGFNWKDLQSFIVETESLLGTKNLEGLMKVEYLESENIGDSHKLFGFISEGRNLDINQTDNYMNLIQLLEDKDKLQIKYD